MSTLLLNDTSDYHFGCVKVVEHMCDRYNITDKIPSNNKKRKIDFKKYDTVILNGEGSMHHNTPACKLYMDWLNLAQNAGCDTKIVNSVWQSNKTQFDNILKKCSTVQVREVLSQKELKTKHNISAAVCPDFSYFCSEVPTKKYSWVDVYEGQYLRIDPIGGYPRIDIFNQRWDEIVNRLRNANLLITGRHHEMYAACVAECKFLVKPSNTWKNEGLLKSANVNIPFDIEGALAGEYDKEYEKLWTYLRSFKNSF